MSNSVERLQLATAINNSFQVNIQHADNKAGMVAVVYTGIVTAMVSRADALQAGLQRNGWVLGPILAAWAVTSVLAAVHLTRAVRPRTGVPARADHFAFPTVAASGAADLRHVPADTLCDEAARLGVHLADIATRKYRAVGRAMTATAGSAAATVAGLLLTALMP